MRVVSKGLYARIVISAICIIAFYFVATAVADYAINKIAPPAGTVFQRLPTLTGVYECCGMSATYPFSTVGGHQISCQKPFYVGSPHRNGDLTQSCGLQAELNDRLVDVEQAIVPSMSQPLIVVTSIASGGKVFFQRSDELLRRQWIDVSESSASAVIFGICGAIAALIFSRFYVNK